MASSIIIKLLSHHLCNNGRILVRLSGVNRLWRTLLRRYPDGAFFCFCQKACERLFINMNYSQNQCVEAFFFHMQLYQNEMTVGDMYKDIVLKRIPEQFRVYVRPKMKCWQSDTNFWRLMVGSHFHRIRWVYNVCWSESNILKTYSALLWTEKPMEYQTFRIDWQEWIDEEVALKKRPRLG